MQKQGTRTKKFYFSDRLKRQLAQIPHHPLTIVEAPSGFGKTTAIREYLKENLSEGARAYWYTCLGEPAPVAWRSLCALLANVNGEIAANLQKLEMPTMDTLLYMLAALKNFDCESETYLVIDNYQLVACDIPRELISVFSMHGNPNLHMIFITQQLGTRQQFTLTSADIHTINAPAFFFDREGTASLFRMEGIRLSESELESVFLSTEGWVSAIRLQIISFRESGLLDVSADIERLVETAIWNRLTPEGKDFLLSVSVLDSFTARQAAVMMERETLPEDIEEMLKANDFIRYHPDNGLYIMHGILQDYLRNRFYHHQPESFQWCMLHRAGKSLAADSQYFPAARLFFRIRDYDAILSLPFDVEYLSNQKQEYVLEFIAALAEACPEETLRRYPFVLLAFSIQAYMGGRTEILEKLFRLISEAIETGEGLSPDRIRRLKGEFMLTSAFCAFNDIKKMDEGFRAAWEILRGPSEMIRSDTSFTFGCPSSLFVFWRESGALETAVQDLDRTLPNYRRLTREHGAGANSVMRAEVMLMRGEDDEAEIFCHKALYDARSHRQAGICLCAELVLARIAILRGDVDGYFIAVRNIQGYAEKNANLYVLRMVDLCMTAISLVLGRTEGVAQWFSDMESIQKTVYTPVLPYAQTLYSMLLLLQKRYNEFLGISESMLDAARGVGGNIRYMLPELYQYKYLAAVHLHQGNAQKAQEYYDRALEMALPDKVYLPMAQQIVGTDSLMETAKRHISDREGIDAIAALSKRQERGIAAIRKALEASRSPLTPREREIAQLARDRLSAREIAGKLFLSEATVKTVLKSVYSKLNVHSKSELTLRKF